MKATKHILPAPDDDFWKKIIKRYNIPDAEMYDDRFYTVFLPPGWTIIPHETIDNFYLLNENFEKIGLIYQTERVGFMKLWKNKINLK